MTDFELYSLVIAASGVLVALFGLSAVVLSLRQNTRQQQATIFVEYVKRFNEIIDETDSQVMLICMKKRLTKDDRKIYDNFITRYLALLHQEFALKKLSLIDKDIWNIWMSYFVIQVNSTHFEKIWQLKRDVHSADPEFVAFIDKLVTQANT